MTEQSQRCVTTAHTVSIRSAFWVHTFSKPLCSVRSLCINSYWYQTGTQWIPYWKSRCSSFKRFFFFFIIDSNKPANKHTQKQTKQTIRLRFERQNWADRTCTLWWSQGELCGKTQASFHLPLSPSVAVIMVLSNSMSGFGRDHLYTYINDLRVGAISILKAMEISFNSWSDWYIKAKPNPGLTTH